MQKGQRFCEKIYFDSMAGGDFGLSWRFAGEVETLCAMVPEEVLPLLARIEAQVGKGFYAAGFIAYEAAGCINRQLSSHLPATGLPLIWFKIFEERFSVAPCHGLPLSCSVKPGLQPVIDLEAYRKMLARVRAAISKGETYQINYTFPMHGEYNGDLLALYRSVLEAQQPKYGAYMDTGRFRIISASPELFFAVRNGVITTRPMKGTAPRGRFRSEDDAFAEGLASSDKDRAENLMIVDLLRNDLSQVAQTGSVQVAGLFEIERYPTVHQMTSSIMAELAEGAGLTEILQALFPCGSVTGAPKRKSMELIKALEDGSRGVYCGAIGCLAPGGEATFSVAIRTLVHDSVTGIICMGVGSGVTWGSDAGAEYRECLGKAEFALGQPPPRLLESLLLRGGSYPYQEHHMRRLAWSASRAGHRFDRLAVEQALYSHLSGSDGEHKVRLLLNHDGSFQIESQPLLKRIEPLRLAVSSLRVDPLDLWLYIKNEQRSLYQGAMAEHPGADEVLLVNKRGELTEGCNHNLVLKLGGRLVTPPLHSGLLPGVMREILLERGEIYEQQLYPSDLKRAEEIWLINSVRGWQRGELG